MANDFFSGIAAGSIYWYNTGPISEIKKVLNLFLIAVYLKGLNFALGLKASIVLASNEYVFV